MPKLATDREAVADYFCRVCRYWLEFHIDGWRLDVASEVNDDFWRRFYRTAKSDESGSGADRRSVGERGTLAGRKDFDSSMNYDFRKLPQVFASPVP